MNKSRFDCVKYQREFREKMLSEAGYDLNKLAENIKRNVQKNELYIFFQDRKNKKIAIN
jgi:hypothetical protein